MKTTHKSLLILILLFAGAVKAQAQTRVLHINSPESLDEPIEVLTSNNKEVLELNPYQGNLLDQLNDAKNNDSLVELEVVNGEITDIEVLGTEIKNQDNYLEEELHPMTNYTPSNVESMDIAKKMFNSLYRMSSWRRSQCFNRAHVWAKQMFDKYETKSMKILIYYTKKYRREVSSKWWFHIAPMISVNGENMVMDRSFTREPVTAKRWEEIFTKKMKKKGIHGYRCKFIKNIKEFYTKENQKNEYCNIQVTSMYYWEPNDMSRLDKTGKMITDWSNGVLKAAAKGSFFRWKRIYNKIKVK